MQIGTIDLTKLRGSATRPSGRQGVPRRLLGSERLQDEGEAQQERATASSRRREELKAQKEDTKAKAMEKREQAAQRAKAS